MTILADERFSRKVRTDGAGGCHLWTGARNVWGYGRLKREGVMLAAHRVAWEMAHGPIPDGLHVLHHCDVRLCVNPEHLFLGTHADNMRDMSDKKLARAGISTFDGAGMPSTRFELLLPAARRRELDALAAEAGLSSSDVVRLAIARLVARPGVLFAERGDGERTA
jgi:hypothetical protein